jgi:probable HAF family extracellular repeat protein
MPMYTYTTLDDPNVANSTRAFGINDHGQIVGSYTTADHKIHGFLYSNGNYTTLDDPLATGGITAAIGINAAGLIVGLYDDNTLHDSGFLRDANGTYTTFSDSLGTDTDPAGINASGQIVGTYFNNTGNHGFSLSGGNYTTLEDTLGTRGTIVSGINTAGFIVGYYSDATGNHASSTIRAAPVPTPPSTIPWARATPSPPGSTMRARSSGITLMMPAVTSTASSIAAGSTSPSTIPRPPTVPLRRASTTQARSWGTTATPRAPTASCSRSRPTRRRRRARPPT